MDETTASIKLFAGFSLTKSLQYHWNKSKQIDSSLSNLIEITHQGASYIGIRIETDTLLLNQLYQLEIKIKNELEQCCTATFLEENEMVLFGQVFIH